MGTILVSVVKEATVEVDPTDARRHLIERGEDCEGMSDDEVAECYVSFAEGNDFELCFDRNIHALQAVA